MLSNGIPDKFLEKRLVQKGLIRKIKDNGHIIYSSIKKDKIISHPIQALLMWNKYIRESNSSYGNGDENNILDARLFALSVVIKKEGGLDAIFNYFKNNWPHLICCNQPCRPRIMEIIFKLSHSSYFITTNGKHKGLLRPRYKSISGGKHPAKIELPVFSCSFHPEEKAVNFAGQSKTPICALCRSKIANGIQKGEINKGMQEEEIFLWVKLKAEVEKK